MPELAGTICLNKRLRRHAVWQRPDYGWAWVDLLLLANDAPRDAIINGEAIPLKRGQLAWSLRTLEKEWNKSGEWLSHFLNFCRDNDMVRVDSTKRRTIITIINYDAYNPPLNHLITETEPETDTGTVPASKAVSTTEQKGEGGIGKGKGEGEAGEVRTPDCPEVAVPTLQEVRDWASGGAGVDPDYAESQWRTTNGNHAWQTKSKRLIDWKELWLGRWLQDRDRWKFQKNSAPPAGGGQGAGKKISLGSMREVEG